VDGGESRELTDLLAAADSALYHAKETGRNKTHVVSAGLRALLPAPRPAT
jgi:PleD family two-component response regulator